MNTDDTFRSLKDLCCASDCNCLLPILASHGWCSINKIRTAGPAAVSRAFEEGMAPNCWHLLCSLIFASTAGPARDAWVRILHGSSTPHKKDAEEGPRDMKRLPAPPRSTTSSNKRKYFPLIRTAPDHSKGLLSIALAVGSSAESRDTALEELSRDECGNSSRGPRDARWGT